MWLVGDGRKIRFWEDHWLGNSSLAIQFWPLYVICEQQGKTISQVWDGEVLILSYRRSVFDSLMSLWYELLSIIKDVHLNDESDQIIWSFSSNGKFSVQPLYAVINHHGVTPIYVHAIWKLTVPPRIQFFL